MKVFFSNSVSVMSLVLVTYDNLGANLGTSELLCENTSATLSFWKTYTLNTEGSILRFTLHEI